MNVYGKRLSKELVEKLGIGVFNHDADYYGIKKIGNKIIFKIFIYEEDYNEVHANLTHSFEMKVFGEDHKITMVLETDGEFSLNELIDYFNKFELFIRNNIQEIEFEEPDMGCGYNYPF